MKIVIVGISKTGTTGLFYKIRNSVQGQVREIFEVPSYEPRPEDHHATVLAKILLGSPGLLHSFRSFDKKIGIIRDPRDTLISRLLYRLGYHCPYLSDKTKLDQMIRLLQEKEHDSRRVSVLDIMRLHSKLSNYTETLEGFKRDEGKRLLKIQQLVIDREAFFKVRYEDFLADDLAGLEKYLGFSLRGNADVQKHLTRVVRSKRSGDWKNWYLQEDVEFFSPLFNPFLERNGYGADWRLADKQTIDPAHSSQYFKRLVSDKMDLLIRLYGLKRNRPVTSST